MLTLQDCLDFAAMDEDLVEAVAEHEHIPCICAAELCNCLAGTAEGRARMRVMVMRDIEAARARGDLARLSALESALRHLPR